MSSNPKFVFGFELLQKLVDNDICKKEDVIILFVHWYIIKCGFKCLGYGDVKLFDTSERGSELLPENWNKGPNYTLRYLIDGKLFLLYGIKSDEDILINLLRIDNNNIGNIQFPIEQTVNKLHGPLEELIPSYLTIMHRIRKELLEPVFPIDSVDMSTQTSTSERKPRDICPDPLRVDPPQRPSSVSQPWNPEADPRRVGSSDLDPLGRGRGGGMIYDPFSRVPWGMDPRGIGGLGVPGRLPHGAVPPGARFDIFGPPDLNPVPRRPQNPDNDELPPPGYDDMFM
ncbi:proteasome inhibitor PI31 subunit [Vespa crabro]|uniref:proteasome inhibitor PI31 subunit n=1 Tax=Vespa crabro TaxID=7445 RepID=UPI001EFFC352|nr:proteasome inhibitor PI31 subunit [Vespa crabro]